MTSTIGVKKIQYPNGTDILTLDSSGTLAIGGATTTTGDITTSNSSGHRSLTVKGNSTTNFEGGSLLLANEGMDTNYGGTYLYHHKAGGSGTDDAAFNISQRSAAGVYVSNIYNVDYKNNAHSFYVPNGGASGATVLGINASGHVTLSTQPSVLLKKNGNLSAPQNSAFQVTGWTSVHDVGSMFNSSNSKITVPTAGSYIVGAALQTSGVTGLHIAILKNDAAIGTDSYLNIIDGGAIAMSICVTASANDYFSVSAYVTHSGLNIQGNRSKFWLVKVA